MHRRCIITKTVWISILLLALLFQENNGEDCKVSPPDNMETTTEDLCQGEGNIVEDEPCKMKDVELTVIDASAGDVGLKFRVTRSRFCKTYSFELSVNDTLIEPKCVNSSKRYINKKHSTLQLNINHTVVMCEEEVNCGIGELHDVRFNEVYKGCYKLYYCALNLGPTHGRSCHQLVKYLNTSFEQTQTSFTKPKITPQVLNKDQVTIMISGYPRLNKVTLRIDRGNSSDCSVLNDNDNAAVLLERNKEKNMLCSKSKDTCVQDVRDLRCSEVDCYEDVNNTIIKCNFNKVQPGNYCVNLFYVDHPECEFNQCRFYQHLHVPVPVSDYMGTEEPPISRIFVVLAVGISLLIIITFAVVILIFRRRWSSPGRVIVAGDDQSLLQCPEILLLYPYDCKAFMDTMVSLRKVLEEKTGCKVYDCFDPDNAEDLSKNKIDWMRRHISRRSIKILVVESAAAVLHQKALLRSSKVMYRDPMWLDGLFLYALKALTDDVDSNNYHRVFVLRIEGFTAERDSLNHLTPYTRYVVPQHLDMLVSNLCVRSSRRNIFSTNIEDEGSRNLQRFQQDVDNLWSFRSQDPDYLQQMLCTSEYIV